VPPADKAQNPRFSAISPLSEHSEHPTPGIFCSGSGSDCTDGGTPNPENHNPKTQAPSGFGLSTLDFGLDQGTTFTAGSLHSPGLLSVPTARTRTHVFAPLVSPLIVADDLPDAILCVQVTGGSGLTRTS